MIDRRLAALRAALGFLDLPPGVLKRIAKALGVPVTALLE